MKDFLLRLAFGVLAASAAYAQVASQSAASPIVSMSSPAGSGEIKPEQPTAVDASAEIVADPASLLPDLPSVPRAKATLVGGTIEKLDRVRDQITLNVFGGGHMKVLFDPRTHIYVKGAEATTANLREGQRISVDTILDGTTVFARNIRVKTESALGESQGVILKYRADRNELTIRDSLSPAPIRIRLSSSTRIMQGDRAVSSSALVPGSLIGVRFDSQGKGNDIARDISILAVPGTRYTFTGQVVHLNLSTGLLVLDSSTDHKTYEIHFDPALIQDENLHAGAIVTVTAGFETSQYFARTITINSQVQ